MGEYTPTLALTYLLTTVVSSLDLPHLQAIHLLIFLAKLLRESLAVVPLSRDISAAS